MKEFQEFRTQLTEGLEEHVAISHSSMPPNILILRRKTVRQFPNNTMVALYYNDKLDQYFSIPYGGDAESAITPVSLKEAHELMEGRGGRAEQKASWMANFENHVTKTNPAHSGKISWDDAVYHHSTGITPEVAAKKYTDSHPTPFESHFHREEVEPLTEISIPVATRAFHARDNRGIDALKNKDYKVATHHFKKSVRTLDLRAKKYGREASGEEVREEVEQLSEDLMDRLHHIRTSKVARNIDHNDGTKTMNVEPETAHAVLRYHSHLTGAAQTEFEKKIHGSRHTFSKASYEARTGKVSHAGVDKQNIHEATGTMDTLRNIVHGHILTHIKHNDGTKTRVDPTTAKMLLTVHDALHPDNRTKFAGAIEHSKSKFHRIVDFGWKQVK